MDKGTPLPVDDITSREEDLHELIKFMAAVTESMSMGA